jgi:Fic family protein
MLTGEARTVNISKLYSNLEERKALLGQLGGLSDAATRVKNREWLYMLKEETRHSLSIEGHFATEKELKEVLQGRRTDPEVLNYYRTAQTAYDFALQYHREGEVRLDVAFVRHIHSELFREVSQLRGEFRRGGIQIQRAKVRPPEFDIDQYVRAFNKISLRLLEELPILPALARIHTLFESIHPFDDGNGRAGRILLNYLGVSKGYPPIIIKGIELEERERYYEALETADVGFHRGFPRPTLKALEERLEEGDFQRLESLLYEGLLPRLDQVIALAIEPRESLMELNDLAPDFSVKESTLRQWVHRGKLIAIKRQGKLYSHPRLYLGERTRLSSSAS